MRTEPQSFSHRLPWPTVFAVAVAVGLCGALLPTLPAARLPIQRYASDHPFIQQVLPPALRSPDLAPPLTGSWLIIPSINVKERIWEGKSLDVLWTHEGVWHQTGDLSHNLVLAGHRFQYLPPNTSTFYDLGKLKKGDQIKLVWEGKETAYTVVKTVPVSSADIQILAPGPDPELTLYTCADWHESQRLVVVAKST